MRTSRCLTSRERQRDDAKIHLKEATFSVSYKNTTAITREKRARASLSPKQPEKRRRVRVKNKTPAARMARAYYQFRSFAAAAAILL